MLLVSLVLLSCLPVDQQRMPRAQPLRLLLAEADAVVIAVPGKLTPEFDEKEGKIGWYSGELRIADSLLGPLEKDSVVPSRYHHWWKGPHAVQSGRAQLMFLRHDGEKGWISLAQMYHQRVFKEGPIEAYRQAIQVHQEIVALPTNTPAQQRKAEAAMQEWVADLAAHPDTRWDGAMDLWKGNRPEFEKGRFPYCYGTLTPGQRDQIIGGLHRERSSSGADHTLFMALHESQDLRLTEWLIEHIGNWGHPPQNAGHWLWMAVQRLDDPELTEEFRVGWSHYSLDWIWRMGLIGSGRLADKVQILFRAGGGRNEFVDGIAARMHKLLE